MCNKPENENLFDSLGLSVEYGEVEVGETYPIYGSITSIVDDTPGSMVVMVNYHIELAMMIDDVEKIALLKTRCFEPGIFVVKIIEKGNTIKGDCTTVVFGKKQDNSIH